ncbi:unnamed protein product, partial [Didymodactylos carnosus]
MATNSSLAQDFYLACRNGEVSKVKQYLKIMTVDQLNETESHGSTALHAASFYGHKDVVKILFEYDGICRSVRNNFKLTAYEEAKTDDVRELFLRKSGSDRFVGTTQIEWVKLDSNIEKYASGQRHWFSEERIEIDIDRQVGQICEDYLDKSLCDIDGIELIRYFYRQAEKQNSPVYILKAYTAETDYYKVLNNQLAMLNGNTPDDYQNSWSRDAIIGIMISHPALDNLSYVGVTYRGMCLTEDDLKQYKVGTRVMNKTFLSTSTDRHIVDRFSLPKDKRISAICVYDIRNNRSGLNVESISEYGSEKEVLIAPFCAFK